MRGKALGMAVAVLLAAGLLAACSTDGGASGSDDSGAVLHVGRVKDAVTLDPAQATDGMSLNVTTEIMKGLVQFKPGAFDVEPAIAQSWQMSPDGRTWTFELRKGLRFSDGTPLDAQAVKFNFDRWRLISNPYHGAKITYYRTMFGGYPGLIANVRAPAPRTVVFSLTRPFSPFLYDLTMPSFAIGSPKAIRGDLEGFGTHPVGWGPYTLAQWVPLNRIVLRANPAYPVQATYRTVVISDIAEQKQSVQEMERGDVDVLTDPRPDDAALLARMPHVTVYYEPANNLAYLAMNVDRHPFELLAVRKAIAYALDVRAIVKSLYPTGADVADTWTPPGMLGENPAVKAYVPDLPRARALLASAGYRRGFATELFYPTIPRPYLPEPARVAQAIRAQLARIGVRVILRPLDWAVFLDKIHNGEHAMCLAGWSGDNGDPDNFTYTLLDKDSTRRPNVFNYSFWRDEAYHQLMLQGQASSDPVVRARIYGQANAMVHEMVPSIPIVHVMVPVALRTSIGGFVPNPDTHIAFELLHPNG
jgi:peptide/nickel transport system substrate-binding protein